MNDRLELMLEAERRGILPPDKLELLTEARARGLVPGADTQAAPERGIGDSLKRAAGLTARYAVEGLASVPGMVLDPLTAAAGLKPWTQALSSTLTNAGLPSPESGGEKIGGAVARGIAGAAPILTGARALAQGAQYVPGAVRAMLAAPTTEALSQGVGAGASEGVREAGGPEWAALLAGVAAPVGMQSVAGAAKAAGSAVNELRRPITRAGADQIAADTMGRIVQDKTRAIANLREFAKANKGPVGVPGSKPTAAAVAGDYGLAGAEQRMARDEFNPQFANRLGLNNEARIDDLARLRATDQQLAKYTGRLEETTGKLRDAAFSQSKGPVDLDKARDTINRLRKTPEGNRQETARALETLDGWIVTRQAEGRVSPRDAYELHKDIGDLIAGKVNDDKGVVRLAAGLATQVKQSLASEIEKQAPGFRKYLETYSRMSKPIERLQIIRDKLGGQELSKVTNAVPRLGQEGSRFPLSQAKMRDVVPNLDAQLAESGLRMAPYQRDVLSRVSGDLNSEAFALSGGKLPGSDTYQNMASANFLNRVLGEGLAESGAGQLARKAIGFPMAPLERRISQTIADAYLDPEKMLRLLEKARTSRQSPSLTGMLGYFAPSAQGGALGGLLGATP